jgi:hypothetical protein
MGIKIKSDRVDYGRNSNPEKDEFIRCSRCEFIVNMTKRKKAVDGSKLGWGLSLEEEITLIDELLYDKPVPMDCGLPYDSREKSIFDPKVKSGCPQCGTYLYSERC